MVRSVNNWTFLGEKTPTSVLSSLSATPISASTDSLTRHKPTHVTYLADYTIDSVYRNIDKINENKSNYSKSKTHRNLSDELWSKTEHGLWIVKKCSWHNYVKCRTARQQTSNKLVTLVTAKRIVYNNRLKLSKLSGFLSSSHKSFEGNDWLKIQCWVMSNSSLQSFNINFSLSRSCFTGSTAAIILSSHSLAVVHW